MSSYVCHFCGKPIAPEEVLFVDASSAAYFHDELRYQFLLHASSDYPFESGDRFRGLYFRCEEPNTVTMWDENGFPKQLTVAPCNGVTPDELQGLEPNPEERASISASADPRPLRTRACPHCHCHLPVDFGVIPTFSVCLFGGRAAGKTAYLLSLFQQITKASSQLEACHLGTAQLLEESAAYLKPQMDLYERTGVTSPTPVGARLFPLVLLYHNMNVNPPRRCFIALYDIAGEGLKDMDYLAQHEGLKQARTIMLMLDPNMLCDGAYFHAANAVDVDPTVVQPEASINSAAAHDFFAGSIASFLSDAYSMAGELDLQNILAVVTKLDQPLTVDRDLFASTNCLLRYDNVLQMHQGKVSPRAFERVDMELRQFFHEKLRIDIRGQIAAAFHNKVSNPLMLGVSTYTKTADVDCCATFENLFTSDASKHRIIEPFLAILYQFGMVDSNAEEEKLLEEKLNFRIRHVEPSKEKAPKKRGLFRK